MRSLACSLLPQSEPLYIYEFGVFLGASIRHIYTELNNRRKAIGGIYGFDSFKGLPLEPDENERATNDPGWSEGAISAIQHLGVVSVEDAIKRVRDSLSDVPNLLLVPGFFENSLTTSLIYQFRLKQADYIDIDVDLYSSCVTVLDFMFGYGLVKVGTLIGYDDWGGTLVKGKEFESGESRAHKEISEKYNVRFTELMKRGNAPHIQALFIVEGFGGS